MTTAPAPDPTEGQTPVVHEAAEGDALVAGVAKGLRDRRTVESGDGLLVAPLEECVEERLRLLAPDLLALFSRRRLDRALDAKEALDQREGVLGELGVGGERLEEVTPRVCPACDLVSGRRRGRTRSGCTPRIPRPRS